MKDTSVIILAGGLGKRFSHTYPKQFLPLGDKPIVMHSFEILASYPDVFEIIVVADPAFHHVFPSYPQLAFATPGERRQDSLFNGLQKVASHINWVCIHDGARPFISHALLHTLFMEGKKNKAATLGTKATATIKEVTHDNLVIQTLKREHLFEIQTPQFISKPLLTEGYALVEKKNLTVTDDVSFAELLGYPVKIVEGSKRNIKITYPEDLLFAEKLLEEQLQETSCFVRKN